MLLKGITGTITVKKGGTVII